MEGERFRYALLLTILAGFLGVVSVIAILMINDDADVDPVVTPTRQAVPYTDPDVDDDTWINDRDNCPNIVNPAQQDRDEDGISDACDSGETGPASFNSKGLLFL